jgi:hypothetical protein
VEAPTPGHLKIKHRDERSEGNLMPKEKHKIGLQPSDGQRGEAQCLQLPKTKKL